MKNKAQWLIQPDVIAQRISGSDFENLSNVTGITIQQGVTAYIFVDGTQVAQLSGGTYNFISQSEVDNLLNEQATLGLVGFVKKRFNSLIKAITGKKVREVVAENSADNSKLKSMDDVVRRLQPKSIIDVYLKSDSPFNIMSGIEVDSDGNRRFAPFRILCKHLSTEVAVSMQMKITDFNAFINAFLVEKNVVTSSDIAEYTSPYIKAILLNRLRNVDIDEYGIPADVAAEISNMLRLNVTVPGASVYAVREICSSNEAFERLRSVADELYVNEKELQLAIRTNEFRNRLAGVENTQKIEEARTALDLHKALSEINKDEALQEEELDKFYMLLSRQKKIREATNEQEIQNALDDISKLGLLKKDEMDTLRVELLTKNDSRLSVADIMMLQNKANVETKRTQIEEALANERHILDKTKLRNEHDLRRDDLINKFELDDMARSHARAGKFDDATTHTELLKNQIGNQKIVDEYSDARYEVDFGRKKSEIDLELEVEKRKREMEAEEMERLKRQNMDMFSFWADEDEKKSQNDHRRKIEDKMVDHQHDQTMAQTMAAHEQAMRDKELESRRVSATMSADQLMAEQAAQLDSEAQRRMADAIGGAKVSEAENRLRQQQIEDARRREEEAKREAYEREECLRADQRNFFSQISADRDAMLSTMKDVIGTVAGVRNQASQIESENRNLNTRLSDSERHISYREDEVRRLDERLRHEQGRNDETYRNVLSHEEKLQNTTVDAIKAASATKQTFVICPSCGKQVREWKFCEKCGNELAIAPNK
ncbi:MAG: hypothetical protein NC039_05335 [Muribaculaceae bacterium]|nr:hypothetical protein [Muribaculaceae bacterium]